VRQVEAGARELQASATKLLAIGGDHTIALPLLRAVHAQQGPVAVLHFDAHLDTWDTYFGAPTTHGTPFRRASEEGLVDLTASMHVGIRGPLYAKSDLEDDERLGFSIVTSEYLEEHGVASAIERMRARIGDAPLYISIDIDVLDPAHAPGTGTPEAGGLTSRELLRMLRALADRNIIGADLVEVAPAYDHAQLTGVAASHVAYELLSAMAPRN
jgi:agmatinase